MFTCTIIHREGLIYHIYIYIHVYTTFNHLTYNKNLKKNKLTYLLIQLHRVFKTEVY